MIARATSTFNAATSVFPLAIASIANDARPLMSPVFPAIFFITHAPYTPGVSAVDIAATYYIDFVFFKAILTKLHFHKVPSHAGISWPRRSSASACMFTGVPSSGEKITSQRKSTGRARNPMVTVAVVIGPTVSLIRTVIVSSVAGISVAVGVGRSRHARGRRSPWSIKPCIATASCSRRLFRL